MTDNSIIFRGNAGAIIYNDNGKVLAFERRDTPGNWQFPQGGINKDEAPLKAIKREIKEETGIDPETQLILKGEYPDWIVYVIPPEIRKDFFGQVQKWYIFKIKNPELNIDLDNVQTPEFINFKWADFEEITKQIIDFKKHTYEKLNEWFNRNFKF